MTSYSPEIKRVILAALLHDVGKFGEITFLQSNIWPKDLFDKYPEFV